MEKAICFVLFGLPALVLAVAALMLSVKYLDAAPILVQVPEDAVQTLDVVLTAVCEGDYETAGKNMYGTPDLGASRQPSDEVGRMIWDAFVDSTSYELVDECFATDSGLAQKVTFRSLEFSSVTAKLGDRARTLLEQHVAEAEDVSQIYDEENNYREDFVMDVLKEAVEQALREDVQYTQQEFVINLTYKDGRWWVIPGQELLSAVSGGITG